MALQDTALLSENTLCQKMSLCENSYVIYLLCDKYLKLCKKVYLFIV